MGKMFSTNKMNENGETRSKVNVLPRHAAVCIFKRKYDICPTPTKYLEIGISVGANSYVQLILSDGDMTELILPIATWNLLMHKRADVERLAQSAATPVEPLILELNGKHSTINGERALRKQRKRDFVTPIKVQDLTIDVYIIGYRKLIRFKRPGSYSMHLSSSCVLHLFDFCDCINHMHLWLSRKTYLVNDKFKRFVNVLKRNINNITNASDAVKTIRESNAFDSRSLLDCELLTCAINDILYAARNK